MAGAACVWKMPACGPMATVPMMENHPQIDHWLLESKEPNIGDFVLIYAVLLAKQTFYKKHNWLFLLNKIVQDSTPVFCPTDKMVSYVLVIRNRTQRWKSTFEKSWEDPLMEGSIPSSPQRIR